MSYPTDALTFDEFSAANRRRCGEAFHPVDEWSETDWATAAAGELGEACNLIKKRRRGGKWAIQVTPEMVLEELADAVTYIDLLFARYGDRSVAQFLVAKFNIVSDRVGSDVTL